MDVLYREESVNLQMMWNLFFFLTGFLQINDVQDW